MAIYSGQIAEAANDSISDTSNRMTNTAVILVINWYTGGEMAIEQQQIEEIFIYGQVRVFESVKHQCVSRQGASLDTGKDINGDC